MADKSYVIRLGAELYVDPIDHLAVLGRYINDRYDEPSANNAEFSNLEAHRCALVLATRDIAAGEGGGLPPSLSLPASLPPCLPACLSLPASLPASLPLSLYARRVAITSTPSLLPCSYHLIRFPPSLTFMYQPISLPSLPHSPP